VRLRGGPHRNGGYPYDRKRLLELALGEGFTEVARLLQEAGARLPVKKVHPPEPASVTDSWARIDRWLAQNAPGFFPAGLHCILLSLEQVVRSWRMWRSLLDGGEFEDRQPEAVDPGIRGDWWNVGWIPFTSDGGGDHDCADLAPAPGNRLGQIITMNHENGEHRLVGPSFRHCLYRFANDLEDGLYEYDPQRGLT
jgi:cell wall assembly regulator SMI1